MVSLEGIVLWNNQPDREAFGLVRKGVGQSTVLRAVETPYPKVNPIQSNPLRKSQPVQWSDLARLGLVPPSSFLHSIFDDYIIRLAWIVLWFEKRVTIIIITSPFPICVIIVLLSMFVPENE